MRFADEHGLARVGNSDAHALEAIGTGWTTFPGRDADDLRRAIETRTTDHGGTFHAHGRRSSARSASSSASAAATPATRSRGRVRRDGTGRDHGYPGGHLRPPRYDARAIAAARDAGTGPADEDRPRLPVHLPGERRRRAARPLPVREPPPARPRRPDHHRQPRPAAGVGGRHPADRRRLLRAAQRLDGHAHVLAALHRPGPRPARARAVRRPPPPRAVRAVPVAVPAARIEEREHRDVPRLCRLLAVVRARQPGHEGHAARLHGRIAVSAAARHFIDRFFPGDYKVIPNGVDIPRFAGRGARSRAGRTARPTCCSSAGTSRARACSTCSRRTGSCAGPATSSACSSSAAGRRSARRAATWRPAASRRVDFLGPGQRRREGPALPDGRHLLLAGDRRRVVRHRAARGDGRRRADRRLGHPRLQGRRPARPRGPARARRTSRRSWPGRSPGCSTIRRCGPRWAPRAACGPRSSPGRA